MYTAGKRKKKLPVMYKLQVRPFKIKSIYEGL